MLPYDWHAIVVGGAVIGQTVNWQYKENHAIEAECTVISNHAWPMARRMLCLYYRYLHWSIQEAVGTSNCMAENCADAAMNISFTALPSVNSKPIVH